MKKLGLLVDYYINNEVTMTLILETWQKNALLHNLENDTAIANWIANVCNCGLFGNPDDVLKEKIYRCVARMKCEYQELDFAGLSDEETVTLITSQPEYKNREQRDKPPEITIGKYKLKTLKKLEYNYITAIQREYPSQTQFNILAQVGIYDEQDAEVLKSFIEAKILQKALLEEQINLCTTNEEIDLIDINFI